MKTILLVDDDVDLIEVYRLAIGQYGHQVQSANSAEEARQLLKTVTVDAVVLDVMMERMDSGFELAQELRANRPELPVILLTGMHKVLPQSLRFEPSEGFLPATKLLNKPIDPAVLAQEVDALLVGRAG
jgi:two-component system response regulator SaeR